MTWAQRDQRVIWHPYTQMLEAPLPIALVRGEGACLYDDQGREYLDAIASWWVNLHGHAHPHIAQRVSQQLQTLEHAIFARFTHPPAIELAERLLARLPGYARVFYSDNGSTAVEVALKIAMQYWHNQGQARRKIIALAQGYHGDTFGAMSVSERGSFTAPFEGCLFEVFYLEPPLPGKEQEVLEQLHHLLENAEEVAAFIFEPLVQGVGGMLMHSPAALEALVKACHKHGILTIADEVMTGFGRTGLWFASESLPTRPDLICLSKGLTGGTMALGATICRPAIYEAFLAPDKAKMLFHGHSFTANPLACTAALASLDLLEQPATWENIARIAHQHHQFLAHLQKHPKVKACRTLGVILALEIQTTEATSYFHSLRDRLAEFFLAQGVLLRPLGNIVYILPPYVITANQLERVYQVIESALETLVP